MASSAVLSAVSKPMGGVGAVDIVVDRRRHADGLTVPGLTQRVRSPEASITADHDEAGHTALLEDFSSPRAALLGLELSASRRFQNRAPSLKDVRYRARLQCLEVSTDQAVIAAVEPNNLETTMGAHAHHAAHRRIHTGSIATAREHTDGEGHAMNLVQSSG